jgi:hypothetical protein
MSSFASPAQQTSYREQGYVFLKRLFPPLVLQLFHGRMQMVLDLKNNPRFHSQTWLVTKPTLEVYSMHSSNECVPLGADASRGGTCRL